MADEISNLDPGTSILSAFDKLKLGSSNSSYLIKSKTRNNINPSVCSVIDRNSKTSVTSEPTDDDNNDKNPGIHEKSIDSQTDMMFGSLAKNSIFGGSPSVLSNNSKTMKIPCEVTTDSVTKSSSNSSLSSSIASMDMVLPRNSANKKAGNFEMFSIPSPTTPSSLKNNNNNNQSKIVQKKINQFDLKEVSIRMLKSSKCAAAVAALSNNNNNNNNICAPPPKVPLFNCKIGGKKQNSKIKNQNLGKFPLMPGSLALATNNNSLDNKKRMQLTNGADDAADDSSKKKRCSDRYDSSESSDSGVATSLSCTDSSTASSDVSDPGSPYSPVLIGDELTQKSIIMPPQTILATTNGNAGKSPTTTAATPVQNVLKSSKQQQQKQSQNNKNQQHQPKLAAKSQLSSSPLQQKANQHIWPWTTLNGVVGQGTNFTSEMASSPKTNVTTSNNINNNKNSNKRHSQQSSTPTDGGAKKTRTTNANSKDNNNPAGSVVNFNGIALQQSPQTTAPNNKRLKIAALEESQTKITGYFKSQMKAQAHHQSGLKKDNTLPHILPSPPLVTVSASSSISLSSSALNNTVSTTTTKPTSSSLNKYFSLLNSQMREEQERNNASSTSLPSTLKKIERSKPTKIAQVAPNLRKTTAAPPLSQLTEKSPKKHVAIAPRTADTRPRHDLSVPSPLKAPKTPPQQQQQQQQQQPAVLLTAIHIPQSNQQPPQLVPTSPRQQQQQLTVGKAQTNNSSPTAAKIPTGPSLYQIPMMPNLVQFPNLIATNVSQLTGARGTHHHHHHPATAAQYFLNGTVFKLQQYTPSPQQPTGIVSSDNQSINTATITNSITTIEASASSLSSSNNKNTSAITATSLQEMLSNQFQTQQQQSVTAHNHRLHHSQPVFMATTTGLLLNAASLPAMLAAGTGKQTVAIQPQQIPALQPIQGATMMPGLSSIFSPHQDQQMQQYKSDPNASSIDSQIPPLHQQQQQQQQPTQTNNIPPLSVSSSAFSKLAIVKAGNSGFAPSVHQVSATQPPPLVTISSGSPIVSGCGGKTKISAKLNGGQQESLTKSKRTSGGDSTKKSWLDSMPLILPAPPPPPPTPQQSMVITPPKSPPALIYPSLIAKSPEVPPKNEDIFDILKNSTNETNLNASTSTTSASSTPNQSISNEDEKSQLELNEDEDIPHAEESSSLLSAENTSNTILSEESTTKDSPPQSPPEYSVASSSLISVESPQLKEPVEEETEVEIEIEPKPEVSVTLPSPPSINPTIETSLTTSDISFSSSNLATKLSPTVDIALADNDSLPKCAISPILSQPKTIRFPAKHESGHRFGPKGMRRHDGVCYWDKCNKKHDSNSKLLDHMQTHHVNTQTGPFACLWLGCKVYGRESCSRRWLERHVLSHGGTKPFKCIVDGCGLRFGSQLALQKHVNGHFTATENKDSTNKRTSDPPVPKLLRKNGKKLRYRRQPFSARMFDFFDTGIMEGLHHRLRQISTLTNGKNCVTFRGRTTMRRKNPNGTYECFVEWAPPNIISNEWLPESKMPYIKTLPINRMQPNEKTNVESLLRSAYRLPHSPNLFPSFHSLSRQNSRDSTSTNSYSQSSTSMQASEDATDDTSRSSSFGLSSLCSVSNLPLKFPQIELRQKQSRKQPKRIQPS